MLTPTLYYLIKISLHFYNLHAPLQPTMESRLQHCRHVWLYRKPLHNWTNNHTKPGQRWGREPLPEECPRLVTSWSLSPCSLSPWPLSLELTRSASWNAELQTEQTERPRSPCFHHTLAAIINPFAIAASCHPEPCHSQESNQQMREKQLTAGIPPIGISFFWGGGNSRFAACATVTCQHSFFLPNPISFLTITFYLQT